MSNRNAKNGAEFEHEMENELTEKNIPHLSQVTFKESNCRLDHLVRQANGIYEIWSDKNTLRERGPQAAAENAMVRCGKLGFKKIRTRVWTRDNKKTIKNFKNKIRNNEFLSEHISDVMHIDDLPEYLSKIQFSSFPPQCMNKILRYGEERSNYKK